MKNSVSHASLKAFHSPSIEF